MPHRLRFIILALALVDLMTIAKAGGEPPADYPIRPVSFERIAVEDAFWSPRLEINRTVTIPYCFEQCEQTGRIDNFAKAGGLMDGPFEGIFYNDSDVFKVIEGAAYSLAIHPDPKLDAYLDGLIAKIAAAQEDDGYLYTARTLRPNDPPGGSGPTRWSNLGVSHELYNVGHLYEAAAAHFRATGKRGLLEVALRNADLIDRVFGPDGRRDVPGHEEIEIGLVRLYRVTGEARYLHLAKFFVDERGRADHRELYGAYCQDHVPVVEQRQAVGHAVRAGYLYRGVADIAAMTGEPAYIEALNHIWRDVVHRKMSLTGGIGASRHGEAFGEPYELPNATVYNETCAAIANALWNHRMFLLTGEGRYIDVLERVIYNGFLSGVSLDGDRFFYPNPLTCTGSDHHFNHGSAERAPWFGTSCCPVNIVRFVPSIAGFVYASKERSLYVNLFVGGEADLDLAGQNVTIEQNTNYPWAGQVMFTVTPEKADSFAVRIRVPGWARGQAVPGDLYRFADRAEADQPVTVIVNGRPWPVEVENGYLTIDRRWQAGDRVLLDLPMPVRRIVSHPAVEANRDRVALQRGPVVYCIEGADHGGEVLNLVLADDIRLSTARRPDLLGGVTVIHGTAAAYHRAADGSLTANAIPLIAIPYYAWNHRGAGEMNVWVARDIAAARVPPPPTLENQSAATASHVHPGDSLAALSDRLEPGASDDHSIPRFTWWDHRGTREWVRYDLPEPMTVSSVSVYWFDDTGQGQCRVPESWRVRWRDGAGQWRPVTDPTTYGVEKDRYNTVTFEPVEATAMRLEVILRPEYSGGVLEWKVN